MKLDDVTDGLGHTLLVVEVAKSGIHWMEPRDLKIDTMSFKIDGPAGKSVGGNHPLKFGWFGNHGRCAHAVSADGRRVRCLSDETSPDELRSMLINDGSEMGGPSR
jgi:hypothetical protein